MAQKKSSKKESHGTKKLSKYFIGYNDDNVITPLRIRLPQMIGSAKYFDHCKKMSFEINDGELLKTYDKIWEKINDSVKNFIVNLFGMIHTLIQQ